MSSRPGFHSRERRGLVSRARSAGGYFTDGVRLLHLRALSNGKHARANIEDCRTLALSYASLAELDRMRLHPVAVGDDRAA